MLESIIVLDARKLGDYFNEIKSGFHHSPRETLIAVIVIALIIITPILLFRIWQKRLQRKAIQKAQTEFEDQLSRKNISTTEAALLSRLVRYTPRGKRDAAQLLVDRRVFNSAVKKYLKADNDDDASIAAVRIKLGLTRKRYNMPLISTGDFCEDMPIRIVLKHGRTILGQVSGVGSEAFAVNLPGRIAPGSRGVIEVIQPAGLFSVSCSVIRSGGGQTEFRHSERVRKIQNRSSIRKKMRLPVYITPVQEKAKHYRSRLIDLSAGGVRVENSGIKLETGDKIILTLPVKTGKPINIGAVVARRSDDDGSFSASFVDINEATREKIIGMVFH